MKDDNHETEVKFPVQSAKAVMLKAVEAGAICEQEPQFEKNLRFDDAKGTLKEHDQVLRLRWYGGRGILTYKADKHSDEKLADREEIETTVSDYDRTRLILERLGFRIFFIYEKVRSIYRFGDTELFFDHTPIGDFVEIEGADEESIRRAAGKIGLDWNTGTGRGYRAVFHQWKTRTGCPCRDMTFDNIKGWERNAG